MALTEGPLINCEVMYLSQYGVRCGDCGEVCSEHQPALRGTFMGNMLQWKCSCGLVCAARVYGSTDSEDPRLWFDSGAWFVIVGGELDEG